MESLTVGDATWNIYRPADIKTATIKVDGIFGESTWTSILPSGTQDTVKDQKPFICPCCGGNSYSVINGNIRCDYCNTKFGDKKW